MGMNISDVKYKTLEKINYNVGNTSGTTDRTRHLANQNYTKRYDFPTDGATAGLSISLGGGGGGGVAGRGRGAGGVGGGISMGGSYLSLSKILGF